MINKIFLASSFFMVSLAEIAFAQEPTGGQQLPFAISNEKMLSECKYYFKIDYAVSKEDGQFFFNFGHTF
jgi:hypothetical protein